MGQHGLHITSREENKLSLLTFNNQASVILDGEGTINNLIYGNKGNDRSKEPYSMMVEYEIDEEAMTVRQKWSYGEYMPEYYCSYRSGTDVLLETGNRLLFTCGSDRSNSIENPFNPHFVEVTEDGDVVYHLEIEDTDLSVYRGTRVDLYHPAGIQK
jgi:hypothetical protein